MCEIKVVTNKTQMWKIVCQMWEKSCGESVFGPGVTFLLFVLPVLALANVSGICCGSDACVVITQMAISMSCYSFCVFSLYGILPWFSETSNFLCANFDNSLTCYIKGCESRSDSVDLLDNSFRVLPITVYIVFQFVKLPSIIPDCVILQSNPGRSSENLSSKCPG